MNAPNASLVLLRRSIKRCGLTVRQARTIDRNDNFTTYRAEVDWLPYYSPRLLNDFIVEVIEPIMNARITCHIEIRHMATYAKTAYVHLMVELLPPIPAAVSDEPISETVSDLTWLATE